MQAGKVGVNAIMAPFVVDPRSLFFFRKGLALAVIDFVFSCLPNSKIFYSNEGVLPCQTVPGDPVWRYLMNLNCINGSVAFQAFLFFIAIVLAMLLFLDVRPRVMMFGLWMLFISLTNRNPLILYGPDIYLRLLLFWGMFLPTSKKNDPVCSVATAGILLQVCMVYFFTAWYKSAPPWWPAGTAVYNALHLKTMVHLFGPWVGTFPLPLLRALTYLVFFTEWLASLVLLASFKAPKIRLAAVGALIGMHLAFGACLYIGPMSGICIAALIVFVPKAFWDRVNFDLKRKYGAVDSPSEGSRSKLKRPVAVFLVVCILLSFLYNLSHVPRFKGRLPSLLLQSAKILGLDQEWNIFAPQPLIVCIWYFTQARLADGRIVDISRHGKAPDSNEPANYREIYPNRAWIVYIKRVLFDTRDRTDARSFADFLQREWNKTHSDLERVTSLGLYRGCRRSAISPEQGNTLITHEVAINYGPETTAGPIPDRK